jgi:hypothetical protein
MSTLGLWQRRPRLFQEGIFHFELGVTLPQSSRISASTSDVDPSPESIALRSFTHLFAVLGFSPNSLQTSVVGLPVEMM